MKKLSTWIVVATCTAGVACGEAPDSPARSTHELALAAVAVDDGAQVAGEEQPAEPRLIPGIQHRIAGTTITGCVPVDRVVTTTTTKVGAFADDAIERRSNAPRTYDGRTVVSLGEAGADLAKQEASEVYLGRRQPTAITILLECPDPKPCACPPPSYVLGHFVGEGPGTPCAVNVRPCKECEAPNGNGVCAEIVWWQRGPDGVCRVAQGPDIRPCDRGCFDAKTRLLLPDGTTKAAQEIRAGDQLWNPVRKKGMNVARVLMGTEQKPLVRVETAQATLLVTTAHPMRTARGLVTASDLRVDDVLQDGRGAGEAVRSLAHVQLRAHEKVWNFELEGSGAEADHFVVANGIVTGDLVLQRRLQQREALRSAMSVR